MDLVPLKKPYTLEEFKRKTDLYLQGMFGTSDKQFYIDKITEEYDKAKDAGLDTKAGIEFIKERNKMYKTLADEGRMQGDPAILGPSYGSTREEFDKGSDPTDFNRNPLGKNQYTSGMRTAEEIQKAIDKAPPKIIDGKEYPLTRKDLRGEGKYYKNKIAGRKELERFKDVLKIPSEGKPITKDTRGTQNLKTSQFTTASQGSAINMDKVNNFGHFAPKLKSYLTSTANTGPIKASVNRYAEGYDKAVKNIALEQERLITKKPKNWKELLIRENYKAANLSKRANKELPKGLKGTLGYFTVDSKSGEFKLKGVDKAKTFAGLSGEEKFYKTDMTTAERKKFGEKQSKIQSIIDKNPGLKRATSIKGGGGTQMFDPFKPSGLSPFRKTKYLSKGGPVYGKYAKQISKLSS
jgi:hypothetical protein|tara:strand:+ start:1270 stop:2496 length:1227 start_codon:yes stop_codon:yes gene_type:complete